MNGQRGRVPPAHHHASTGDVIVIPCIDAADVRHAEHDVEMTRRQVKRDLHGLMLELDAQQRHVWDKRKTPEGELQRVFQNRGAQYG